MAQILAPETMARLNAVAADLAAIAVDEARAITRDDGEVEDFEQAQAVNAVVIAVSSVLQVMPLNQLGAILAMGAVYGTVLGQCDGDRAILHKAFSTQASATLAEIAAARMVPVGTA